MIKTKAPQPTTEPVLHRILNEAWTYAQANRRFLAVFDLDSTLLDLTLRVAAIVEDFRNDPANLTMYPEECLKLKDMIIKRRDWGLKTPVERAGMSTEGTFFRALERYWATGFFSNDYLFRDEPLPGAVSYVQELHQLGAEIMYLTGRDIPRMFSGTEESLRTRGFPIEHPNVHVVLKPDFRMDDAQFKLDTLKEAEEQYERIWLFENEPVNLNLIATECPEIGLVFIDSTHSGREELKPILDRIAHFECDLEEFRKTNYIPS